MGLKLKLLPDLMPSLNLVGLTFSYMVLLCASYSYSIVFGASSDLFEFPISFYV
jgi:hypothetical protein